MLKIPRKRLVRNVRLALGIVETSGGRGGAQPDAAKNLGAFAFSGRANLVPPWLALQARASARDSISVFAYVFATAGS